MEAIWNLENKWKISTHGAVSLLVVCICSLVIGTCIIAALRRYVRKRTDDQEPCIDDSTSTDVDCSEPRAELGSVKEDLTSSVRWSQKQKLSPLLVSGDQVEADFGWQSRSSDSPVWQRPILMGEKCELPKFSGLILYDQRGHATSSSR
ncbi:uncharacterized protein LOC132619389 [Lycium barbarum]|uniref:uncharacterized protein LOC132619389 n=1 Tax=Lycium barbarum TaxID=112863 RepID=UPI00293E1221|nr:uncharacterized protein LOC132619389 [Lycium barbarum]